MGLLKLKPAYKDYLWGGRRLIDDFAFDCGADICAEAWVLSTHPDGPSVIASGAEAGTSFRDYIEKNGDRAMGTSCRNFKDLPVLIKLIDAKSDLSIQVHPGDEFALKNEGQYGKTEMWYILDAEEGAFLYYGFREAVSEAEFAERIRNNTLTEILNAVPVHRGDVLFIPSGTIHAIGKGSLIAEIQQNSNVTYRVYDYGRVGKDGKPRELHVDKALQVTRRERPSMQNAAYPHVADCAYFTVDRISLNGTQRRVEEGLVDDTSFLSVLILDGRGTITCDGDAMTYRKGDSFFIPNGSGLWRIEGTCDALTTMVNGDARRADDRRRVSPAGGEPRIYAEFDESEIRYDCT